MAVLNQALTDALAELRQRKGNPTNAAICEMSGVSAPVVSVIMRGVGGSDQAVATVWSALGGRKAELEKARQGVNPFADEATQVQEDTKPTWEPTDVTVTATTDPELVDLPPVPAVVIPQAGDTLILGNAGHLSKQDQILLHSFLAKAGINLVLMRGEVEIESL